MPNLVFRNPSLSSFLVARIWRLLPTVHIMSARPGFSRTPRPRLPVYACPCALGQRRRVRDYLVEQEQREADEHQGRYGYDRQPPALEFDLIWQCPPVEHYEHRRVEGHHEPPA